MEKESWWAQAGVVSVTLLFAGALLQALVLGVLLFLLVLGFLLLCLDLGFLLLRLDLGFFHLCLVLGVHLLLLPEEAGLHLLLVFDIATEYGSAKHDCNLPRRLLSMVS